MKTSKKKTITLYAKDGGSAFAFMMASYILISFLGQLIVGAFAKQGSELYLALCSFFPAIAIFIVTIYFSSWKEIGYKKASGISPCKPKYFLFAVLLAIGMFFGLGFVNDALIFALDKVGIKVNPINLPLDNLGQFILFTLTFAILPAVVEEIFFRGLLVNSLEGCKKIWAVFTVAVCFSLYHCSLAQFIYQLIYGAVLSILAIRAKSILPCILAHFLNNFIVILFNYLKLAINLYEIWFILAGLICIALFVCFIIFDTKNNCDQSQAQKNAQGTKEFFMPWGILGCALCLIILISNLVVA